jgi:hypothetical protein
MTDTDTGGTCGAPRAHRSIHEYVEDYDAAMVTALERRLLEIPPEAPAFDVQTWTLLTQYGEVMTRREARLWLAGYSWALFWHPPLTAASVALADNE